MLSLFEGWIRLWLFANLPFCEQKEQLIFSHTVNIERNWRRKPLKFPKPVLLVKFISRPNDLSYRLMLWSHQHETCLVWSRMKRVAVWKVFTSGGALRKSWSKHFYSEHNWNYLTRYGMETLISWPSAWNQNWWTAIHFHPCNPALFIQTIASVLLYRNFFYPIYLYIWWYLI